MQRPGRIRTQGFCPVCIYRFYNLGVSYFVEWFPTPFYSCMVVVLALVILLLLVSVIAVLLGVSHVLCARRVRLEDP